MALFHSDCWIKPSCRFPNAEDRRRLNGMAKETLTPKDRESPDRRKTSVWADLPAGSESHCIECLAPGMLVPTLKWESRTPPTDSGPSWAEHAGRLNCGMASWGKISMETYNPFLQGGPAICCSQSTLQAEMFFVLPSKVSN